MPSAHRGMSLIHMTLSSPTGVARLLRALKRSERQSAFVPEFVKKNNQNREIAGKFASQCKFFTKKAYFVLPCQNVAVTSNGLNKGVPS